MKQLLIVLIHSIPLLFVVGCFTGNYQNVPVTSDPNGATITANGRDSFTAPGSFNLLRTQDHILIAEYPGYEPMVVEIKHTNRDLFWNRLEPSRIHFNFIWLEQSQADLEQGDPNSAGQNIVGYKVRQETLGQFVRTPVYGELSEESVTSGSTEPRRRARPDLGAVLQRHSVEVGAEAYHFRYKEPRVMEDNGEFFGMNAAYTYRGWVPVETEEPLMREKMMLQIEGRFASGQVDYDGALMDGTPYKVSNIDDYVYETRLLIGPEVVERNLLASLYSGFGYRYLNDDSFFDPYGYERESNYYYLPLGYQLSSSFENNWAWQAIVEADFLLWGKQRSHLDISGVSYIDNDQDDGNGLRASIRFKNKTDMGILIIEPFIRYWDIDDSDVTYIGPDGYYEPKNTTSEYGIKLIGKF